MKRKTLGRQVLIHNMLNNFVFGTEGLSAVSWGESIQSCIMTKYIEYISESSSFGLIPKVKKNYLKYYSLCNDVRSYTDVDPFVYMTVYKALWLTGFLADYKMQQIMIQAIRVVHSSKKQKRSISPYLWKVLFAL